MNIDELDHDALKELVNISVGRSADTLSRMVGTEILLSIPDVVLLSNENADTELRQRAGNDLSLVRQSFSGTLSGDSLLVFPENNSLELVQLILQEDLSAEMLAELEQEVLRELGNVLLNSFMGTLGNTLDLPIETGLPQYERCEEGSER